VTTVRDLDEYIRWRRSARLERGVYNAFEAMGWVLVLCFMVWAASAFPGPTQARLDFVQAFTGFLGVIASGIVIRVAQVSWQRCPQ
jgi:hypothetical protein